MRKQLRVGVIGVGAMGRNHARIYSELSDIELIGVADINQNLATSIAQSYECKTYADYNDLLSENLDAVSIAVPTTLHKKVALDAIKKRINILIEKPIADTVENADEIMEAAQQKGVKLMIGHVERFNPAIIKLKELIGKGLLGDIISISAKRVGPYNPRIRDVGIILDLGTHDIDIMSYLCSERIKEVYASAGSVVHSHEDHAIITLNFNNGSSGVIETNWLTPHKIRNLTVIGSKGIAEVDYIQSSLRIFDKEWVRDAKIEKEEPLKLELLHFIACMQHDKEPLVSGEEGKHALEVALAAMESARTGRVCQIK
ncbi:MAG: Gfo/Idh/MocA family oxidoreductase [Dehalococcoidia bacterium]|nr:Gfo/Idh/MocA family oxidoreductase [Dehalococcoidia bacterium]